MSGYRPFCPPSPWPWPAQRQHQAVSRRRSWPSLARPSSARHWIMNEPVKRRSDGSRTAVTVAGCSGRTRWTPGQYRIAVGPLGGSVTEGRRSISEMRLFSDPLDGCTRGKRGQSQELVLLSFNIPRSSKGGKKKVRRRFGKRNYAAQAVR